MSTNFVYITTDEEFLSAVDEIKEYCSNPLWHEFDRKPTIALDLETFGDLLTTRDKSETIKSVPMPISFDGEDPTGLTRTIQIGLNPIYNPKRPFINKQFIIDCVFVDNDLISKELKFIENINVIGHNLKYDYQFLFVQFGIDLKFCIDTMLISKVLLAGDKVHHGLDASYERFLDPLWFKKETNMNFYEYMKFKKQNQSSDWSGDLSEDQLRYAAEDVYFLFYMIEQQEEWIKDFIKIYESDTRPKQKILSIIKLENDLVPVYAQMELRGIPFDVKRHEEVIQILKEKQDEAYKNLGFTTLKPIKKSNIWCLLKDHQEHRVMGLNRIVWEEYESVDMNMRSPKQLVGKLNEIFQSDLGEEFRVTKRTREGVKDTTEEDSIKEAFYWNQEKLSEDSKEKIQWVLQYKKASSMASKFGQKMVDCCTPNGFIHSNFHQLGMDTNSIDTGRSSSSGPNLTQQPGNRGDLFPYTKSGFKGDGALLFRPSFAAKKKWKIAVADFSQIEPRIAADVCKVKELIKKFQDDHKGLIKFDIHAWTAKIMMDLDVEPDKDSFERKYIGKTAGLSVLYGKWWATLKEWMFKKTDGIVRWTDVEAEAAWNAFFDNAPEFRVALESWNKQVARKAESYGFSLSFAKKSYNRGLIPYAMAITNMGRPRKFTLKPYQLFYEEEKLVWDNSGFYDKDIGYFYITVGTRILKTKKEMPDACLHRDHIVCDKCGKKLEDGTILAGNNIYKERMRAARTEGFNSRIQGSAADIMKLALLKVHYKLKELLDDWREGIVCIVHDEIVLHVKEEHADEALKIMIECMEEAGREIIDSVPIIAEGHIGNNWNEAK